MPVFETPESINVTIDLGIANVRVAASNRTDTVVEVRPSDESAEIDVAAAAQVRADYANGELRITGPRIRFYDFSRKKASVELSIELPLGSRVAADLQMGHIRTVGRLGDANLKTAMGDVGVELAGPLRAHTSYGQVTADGVTGDADIYTGSGKIQLGEVDGTLAVKSANGDIMIDAVTGDARLRSSNGRIAVERAGSGVDAKTSAGAVRVGEVVRGSIALATAAGNVEVGIAEGTAAWLDVNTSFGHVNNHLEDAVGPDEASNTVEVRGRTSYGDIIIRRA